MKPSRIAALFKPHKFTIAVVVLLISAASVIGLAQPFLIRAIIDDALPHQDLSLLAWLAGGLVAVAAATAAIGVVQTWMATKMGQRVMHELRTRLFTHLQAQSLGFFTRTRGGEVQSRLTNDIAGMQNVVTSTATSVASNLTTAVATAIAMVALSPRMSLLSLVVLPPAIWLSRKVALMRRDVTTARQQELAGMYTQIEEGLSVSGIRLAKTLGTTGRDVLRFSASSHRLIDLELRSQLAGRWRMATMSIVFAAIPAVIYLAAGFPATSGGMTIGTLVAFTALQGAIFRPIMGMLNVGVQWVTAMALFSRIFEYLDLEPEIKAPANPTRLDPETVRGRVRFEGVGFAYGGGAEVLHGIDLELEPGTATAVVGPTGIGQVHARRPAAAPARSDPRPDHHRRDRRARARPRDAEQDRRRGLPGDVPGPRIDPREPAAGGPRCRRRDAVEGAGLRADRRPGRRAARRAGHPGRRPRPPILRRRAAAAGHRPHHPAQPAGAGARRGDQRAGQHHRGAGAGCARSPGASAAPR